MGKCPLSPAWEDKEIRLVTNHTSREKRWVQLQISVLFVCFFVISLFRCLFLLLALLGFAVFDPVEFEWFVKTHTRNFCPTTPMFSIVSRGVARNRQPLSAVYSRDPYIIYTALVPCSNCSKTVPQHELKSWSNSDFRYVNPFELLLNVQWYTCFFKLFFVFWHNQHWSEPISNIIVADTCSPPGLKTSGILNGAYE